MVQAIIEGRKTKAETIYLKDKDGEGGTIFFKELPGIIAEGETHEEALRNLYSLVKFHFANP